ncbi:MAG TPA: hypothetical protein PK695_03215 [Chitinophagaceae bacterium]|nr:hypothetical protein [Chitinophagaceae bacterium]HMX77269.1 hypothetical protein [Chitinophagaceae bacterium]HNA18346.1 hypothetical protein [Chitinophagaceae bacterium]HNA96483.1 hypothetical protein [Chitinophagaceae bacterium]HND96091.1 hypothetical protein [Chitinophagaceae bacterium]
MKRTLFLCLLALTSITSIADAGFSIRRRTAAAKITFEGLANLTHHKLLLVEYSYHSGDSLLKSPFISYRDTLTDGSSFVIQNGGKRWDESERYLHFVLAKNDSVGTVTDSFTVYMKKWNYKMIVTGEKNGKLQYTLKKSKAYFNYNLIDEDNNNGNNKTVRMLFIISSLAGLILLLVLFLKRKNASTAS